MQPRAIPGLDGVSPHQLPHSKIDSTFRLLGKTITSVPTDSSRPQRRRPAAGVFIFRGQATIVFLTVCTERRSRWLAGPVVARDLVASWQIASAWMIGRYVLMPDHLHLFCAPIDENSTIESWITFWKRSFRRLHVNPMRRFQSGGFHHRLRREESYDERWNYVRENPVRAGLVKRAEEWPFAGELNEFRW